MNTAAHRVVVARSKTWREGEISLPAVVAADGSTLECRCIDSVGDLGLDLRDVLDARQDVPADFGALSRTDCVVFVLDPRRSLARANLSYVHRLMMTMEGIGKPRGSVPVVVLAGRPHLPPESRLTPWEIQQGLPAGVTKIAHLDVADGAALERELTSILPLVRAATPIQGQVGRAQAQQAEQLASLWQQDVMFDWGPTGPTEARLLDAWRLTRAPVLATLLDALAYAHRHPRPGGITHKRWVETCRRNDARDLPSLLDGVTAWEVDRTDATSRLDYANGTTLAQHAEQVLERLEGLRWWGPDPRLTMRLASLITDMNRYRRTRVWRALFDVLAWHGDPRAIALGNRVLEDSALIQPPLSARSGPGGAVDLIDSLCRQFEESRPGRLVVAPEHEHGWAAMVERIMRPLPRRDDMDAIAADPTNDALRRELALGMQERGDPRGEFILLQLKKASESLSPEEHEREQALKRTYAWDWLGPLADVVDVENSVFEKGYPVKLTVWTPNTRALRDVIGKAEWGTVREIRWGGDPCWEEEAADPEVVNHPVMKSLVSVTTKMPEDPGELEALRRVAWAR